MATLTGWSTLAAAIILTFELIDYAARILEIKYLTHNSCNSLALKIAAVNFGVQLQQATISIEVTC